MIRTPFDSTIHLDVLDCRRQALTIIREDYPAVKNGVLRLEVFMRRKSRKAVYELRDFMAHFAIIFDDRVTPEDARHNLSECRTHLRRCVVEPLEYQAEKGFVRLDRLSRYFGWVLWGTPQIKKNFYKKMVEAKALIAEGRIVKTEGKATEHFEKAFMIVQDLTAEVGPARYIVKAVFWIAAIFAAGIVTAMAITVWNNICPAKTLTDGPAIVKVPEGNSPLRIKEDQGEKKDQDSSSISTLDE